MGAITDGFRTVLDWMRSFTGSYGVAILLFTVVVRMLLYPLQLKQQKSMLHTKALQPELEKLQQKYKKKPDEYQKKMMEFYRENNFNPLSGCLPLIVQLPIMWILFSVFREHAFLGEGFLWVKALSEPDPLYIWPVLSAAMTWVSSRLSTAQQGGAAAANPTTKAMNYFFPVLILVISLRFPAALVIYWTIGNVVQIAQTAYINRRYAVVNGEVVKL